MNIAALIIAIVLGLILGAGAAMYIFANALNDSNNMGDYLCEYGSYCKDEITYVVYSDDVNKD